METTEQITDLFFNAVGELVNFKSNDQHIIAPN